jgi:hypothetical protein
MKQIRNATPLRLVHGLNQGTPREKTLNAAPIDVSQMDELLYEASRLESTFGINAYSSFLRKHGGRPDRQQAAAIGSLLGGQVRASDGSMQPPLSKEDRAALRGIKTRRKEWAHQLEFTTRFKSAIEALSEIEATAGETPMIPNYDLCTSEIRKKLESAISCLSRFAKELDAHEKDESAEGSGKTARTYF